MTLYKKVLLGASVLLGILLSESAAAVTLQGFQGGTGLSSATSSQVSNCLTVSSSSPFLIYTLASCDNASTTGVGSITGTANQVIVSNATGSVTLSTPQDIGKISTPTFGNTTIGGNATATLSGTAGTASFIPNVNTWYALPTPNQLVASGGATCGTTTGDTDAGKCLNDIYAAGSLNGSTTGIIAGAFAYSYTTPIVFGTSSQLVYLTGTGGNSTVFNFTPTSGAALTLNDCNSNAKRQALQLAHFALSGATTTLAATTGFYAGGSNGACASAVDDLTIRTFGRGVELASNTYMFSMDDSLISNVNQAMWFHVFSNSGEQDSFHKLRIVDPVSSSVSTTQYILIDVGAVASVDFTDTSFDNGGVQVAAGNLNVNFNANHWENPTRGVTGYTYLDVLSSTNTQVNVNGGTMMNDATATVESPGQGAYYANCGGNCVFNGVTFNRNGSATTTVYGVSNTNSTGNAKITMCNTIMNTTPFGTAPFKNGGVSITTNDGCLYGIANNYPSGWNNLTGNQSVYYGNNNGVDITVTGNLNGGATTVTNYFSGGKAQGSSTVDVGGTFGAKANVFSASTTISGSEAGNNGNFSYIYSGTDGTTNVTIPTVAATLNRIYAFGSRGTSKYTITASSTDFISIGDTTTTVYTVTRGGWIILHNDGTRWVVLARSPQRYISPSISGNITGVGCDSATTTVDTWLTTSTANSAVFSTTETTRTAGLYWNTYLTGSGLATTFACSDVTLTVTASTASFTVN